jgi:hypothetical protein
MNYQTEAQDMADNQEGTSNIRQEYNLGRVGLDMDSSVNQIQKGKLSYALNGALENFDANSVSYQNEPSNETCLEFPSGYHLIGTHFIQEKNKHIFFLTNPETGDSEIGYMDNNDCVYRTLCSETITGETVCANSTCLNFDINYPIHKAVHKITNCTTEVYWTDGLNPRRYINIEQVPYVTTYLGDQNCDPIVTPILDCNKLKVQPNFSIPSINITGTAVGGDLQAGTYQFAVQYCNASGDGYTSYYSVTNPTSIANTEITTPDFQYSVGKSILLSISDVDITGYFQYFNLAVIKTINNGTSVELVGTFKIQDKVTTATYSGQNQTQIPLSLGDILEKFPYYDIAQDVTSVQDYIVWDNLTSVDRINYQSIASRITLEWETYKLPVGNDYSDPFYTANLRGYLRDEIYAFEIVFLLDNGKQTDGFHIPGRVKNAQELSQPDVTTANADYIGDGAPQPYWKIYNTATVSTTYPVSTTQNIGQAYPYQSGEFAYWEAQDEEYPCNVDVWGDLAGQKIRHHKFPDVLVSPYFETPPITYAGGQIQPVMQTANAIYPIGVKIDVQQVAFLIETSDLTDAEKASIVGFKIVRGNRSANKSIIAKGILRNVGKYNREGTNYYYPNYPYNDLDKDPFLLEKSNAYMSQCDTFQVTATADGALQYTDCYTGTVSSQNFTTATTEICSLTLPVVNTGAATFKNITSGTYIISSNYRCLTSPPPSFNYLDPITGALETIQVPFNTSVTINSIGAPTFLSGCNRYTIVESSKVNINCFPNNLDGFSSDESKYRQVFNSPETSFGQPTLGNVLKLESVLFGGGRAHFVEVQKHSMYKLLTRQTQIDALNSSKRIADLGGFSATAMFTAYQSYLQIYLNGISRKNFAQSFNSVSSYDYSADIPNGQGVKQRQLDKCQYVFPGVQNVGDNHDLNNWNRESSIYTKTIETRTGAVVNPLPFPNQTPSLYIAGVSQISDNSRFTISQANNCSAPEQQEDIKVVSYYASIKAINNNQWGQIYSYQTIDTGFQRIFSSLPAGDTEVIFGGDTFIGKFGFKTKLPFFIDNRVGAPDDSDIYYDELGNVAYPQYWYSARSILSDYYVGATLMKNIISTKAHYLDCPNDDIVDNISTTTTTSSTTPAPGTVLTGSQNYIYDGKMYSFAYGIPYFYVESSINIDLRQAFNNLEGDFYPHVSSGIPDTWFQESRVPIALDNTYYYNTTFSKQNTENYFSHLPSDWIKQLCFTYFPFRAIYSDPQESYSDNRINSWLIYRPLSFFDFPQNYGKLVSLDGIQNKATLARFENKSLLYGNLLTMNTSNPQAAFLGNPTLFTSAPAIDYAETDLGYVGSQNKFLLKIPNGQITIDAKRGQVFMIANATQAIDISGFGSGLNRFFTDHLAFEILRYFPTANTDNHFNGLGLHGVYDSKFERIIITKLDYIPQPNKQVYYDEALQKFYVNQPVAGNTSVKRYVNLTDVEYFCNKSWTASFNLNTKAWVSFHTYIPNFYIGENNFYYSGLNEGCDLTAIAVIEIPSPTTTSTTTAVPLECALNGEAIYVDINAHWENVGDPYCGEGSCVTYQEQIDTNPNSLTFGDTRNEEVLPNICNTEANYVADGDAYCVECNAYQNYIDNNPCSPTVGNIETNLLGTGAPCDYEPAWVNTGDPYCEVTDPATRTCTSFQLQTNTNPCYTNVEQTRIIVSPVDVCNTEPIWVQLDEAQNYVCVYNESTGVYDEHYKEENQNPCSNGYTQTRTGGLVPGGEGNVKCNAFPNIWYRLEECYTGDLFWSSAFTNGGENNPVIGQLVFGFVPPNFNNPALPIPGRNTQFIIINSTTTNPGASPSIGIASAGGTVCLSTTTTTTTKHTFAFARNTQTSPPVDLCNLGFPNVGTTNPPSSTPAYLSGAAQVEPLTPFVTNYLVVAGTGTPVNGGNNKWYLASGFNLKYHYSVRVDTDGFLHEWAQCSGPAYQAYTVILIGQSDAATACAYPIETSSQTLYADYNQTDGSTVPTFYTDELCSLKFVGNDFWYAWQLGAGTKYSGQISDLGVTSNITAC